jgi:hypothetical protein
MSRFGDLMSGKKPAPAPAAPTPPESVAVPTPPAEAIAPEEIAEDVLISTEEVLTEATPLAQMSKDELEAYGRTVGIELDRRHSHKRLVWELQEHLDTL